LPEIDNLVETIKKKKIVRLKANKGNLTSIQELPGQDKDLQTLDDYLNLL
jgi:hypothetical protein